MKKGRWERQNFSAKFGCVCLQYLMTKRSQNGWPGAHQEGRDWISVLSVLLVPIDSSVHKVPKELDMTWWLNNNTDSSTTMWAARQTYSSHFAFATCDQLIVVHQKWTKKSYGCKELPTRTHFSDPLTFRQKSVAQVSRPRKDNHRIESACMLSCSVMSDSLQPYEL